MFGIRESETVPFFYIFILYYIIQIIYIIIVYI